MIFTMATRRLLWKSSMIFSRNIFIAANDVKKEKDTFVPNAKIQLKYSHLNSNKHKGVHIVENSIIESALLGENANVRMKNEEE